MLGRQPEDMKRSWFTSAKAGRPAPVLEYTRVMAISDAIAFLVFIASVYLVARAWADLPDHIPVHFNIRGEADRWGGKGSLVFGPVLSLCTGLLLGIVNRYPHTFNYPLTITPTNAQQQYTLARELMCMMRMQTSVLGLQLAWMQIDSARGGAMKTTWTAVVLATALGGPLMLLVIYLSRANKVGR